MNSTDDDGELEPCSLVDVVMSNTDASQSSPLVLRGRVVVSGSFSSVSRRPPRRTRYSSRTSHAGHVLTAPVDPCFRERMRKLFCCCFGVDGKSSDSSTSSCLEAESSCQNSTSSWRGRTGTRCVLHLYLALSLEVSIDDMLFCFGTSSEGWQLASRNFLASQKVRGYNYYWWLRPHIAGAQRATRASPCSCAARFNRVCPHHRAS